MLPSKGKIPQQSWMIAPETRRVMEALHANGGEARFVGGCVRNALANKKVLDIDIATPLKPEEVIDRLVSHKINYAPTGLKHGTVTAIADGKPFEITTLRRDVLTFGRHAEVAFTDDWQTDASRRDFTINALFADIEGNIVDYFGGMSDLRLGRVVFVGAPEKRIREDVLRILRFFRFFAHFGKGEPDPGALAACAHLSPEIPKLSPERIRQETLKTLEADRCAEVFHLMSAHGVLTHFLPEATNIAALERLTALEEKHEAGALPLRRLAASLDVTAAGLPNVARALRLSNAQGEQLAVMALPHKDVGADMSEAGVRKLVYRQGNDMARSLLLIAAARDGQDENLSALLHVATVFRAPGFPLQGGDVLSLGWKAGPDVGFVLNAMENWWLSQDFAPGRTACLEKLRTEHSPLSKPAT